MAYRIDVRGAKMPPPTLELVVAMAQVAYDSLREFWGETMALGKGPDGKAVKLLPWVDLPEETRLRWINAQKQAYGVVAIAGGARKVPTPTPV